MPLSGFEPVIRSPVRYLGTTAPALCTRNQWSEAQYATSGLLRLPYTPGISDQKPSTLPRDYCACPMHQEPVIRSPVRYLWTTAPALYTRNQWSEAQYATSGLLRLPYTPGTSDQKPSTLPLDYCACPIHQEPVIRSPVRYLWTTAPALYTRNQWSEVQYATSGLLRPPYTPGTSDQKSSTLTMDYCARPIHQESNFLYTPNDGTYSV